MKNTITIEQFNEASSEVVVGLHNWAHENGYSYRYGHLPSIGEMIGFLGENLAVIYHQLLETGENWKVIFTNGEIKDEADFHSKMREKDNKELCDALWEVIKEVMSQKQQLAK